MTSIIQLQNGIIINKEKWSTKKTIMPIKVGEKHVNLSVIETCTLNYNDCTQIINILTNITSCVLFLIFFLNK